MVKTKITLNDGALTEIYACGSTDAFTACVAVTQLIREMDKWLDTDGKFESAVILGLAVGGREPEDAD